MATFGRMEKSHVIIGYTSVAHAQIPSPLHNTPGIVPEGRPAWLHLADNGAQTWLKETPACSEHSRSCFDIFYEQQSNKRSVTIAIRSIPHYAYRRAVKTICRPLR